MAKTLILTDEQYALLQALLNSDVLGWDGTQDALGEAAAEILGHTDPSWSDKQEDDRIDAEIELQNSLWDALGRPVEG